MLFIALQNGIFIENISTKQIKVKQLYIKWNEKLDVSVKEIELSSNNQTTKNSLEYKEIGHYLNSILYTRKWFNSIIIENIFFNDINTSFKYENKSHGFIVSSSKDIDLNASLSCQNSTLKISINKLSLKKEDINVKGSIYLDTKDMKIYTNLDIDLLDEASLTLYSTLGRDNIFYKIKSNKKIKSIKNLIQFAHLPEAVNYWAYDAIIKMSSVKLYDIYGYIEYANIADAYKNIYVKAIVHDADYKYNPLLDAIHTQKIELEFTQGILNIRPIQAYSYGMFLNKSWLNIDFTKKEELLTLYLQFKAQLNHDVLGILEAYKIKLPFLQHSGVVDTDLKLKIGLREINVDVLGDFYTKKANFDYVGLNIDIADATIKLKNYDVTIKNMKANYKDIADASVNVIYNAKKSIGAIDFDFSKISIKGLNLNKKYKALHAKYTIHPKGDIINVDSSKWKYQNKFLTLNKLAIPFNINDINITIPSTLMSVKNMGNAFISGKVNLHNFHSNLDVDVLNLSYNGMKFSHSKTPFKVLYDNKIKINSKNPIYFDFSDSKYKVDNFLLEIDDQMVSLKNISLEIGQYLTTKLYIKHNMKTNQAYISVNDFILKDPKSENILYKNKKILFTSHMNKDILTIGSEELNAKFTLKDSGWKLKCNSLKNLSKNSLFLEQLHFEDGDFTLYKYNKDNYFRFKSSINYPYKIFVKKNTPLEKNHLHGKIYKDKLYVNINNSIDIEVKDNIQINLNNSVINLKETIRAIKEIKFPPSNNTNALNIIISANKSQLYYSKRRSILYDTLEVQYYNNILSAQLQYKKAKAGLQFFDKRFHIYGKGFNAKFMNQLISLSNFKNGALDFSIAGKTDDYKGVVFIRKTTMKDYKTLNNILAFINTVPSLVTFNVPGYSKNGIFVQNAYVNFDAKNNIFELNNIFLDSKEIDILGRGSVDFNKESLDLTLNLKTDLGSELSKVPLVGYVILGKDTLSTTLSIKGDLEKPKIKSLIAKDIIVAPLNIIKRTLLLPYELLTFQKEKK